MGASRRNPPTPVEEIMRRFECELCGSEVGSPCRATRSGVVLTHAHNSRYRQAVAAELLPIRDWSVYRD